MSIRRRSAIASILSALVVLSVVVPGAVAQPDPALPGVCYATLGNSASDPGALITVNTTTGAGTLVGPTGILGEFSDPGVPALAIKSTGEMYATDIGNSSRLYRVDATTGAATLVATTALRSPTAMAFDAADMLWAVDSSGNLHIVNDSTGTSTLIGPTGAFIKGLAFDPNSAILWGSDASGGVYTINVSTGTGTLVGNTGLPATPDLHFDAAGMLYGSSGGGLSANNLISIDKATGVGQVIGSIGYASVSGMASRLDRKVPVALQDYDSRWVEGRVEVTWRLIGIEGTITFEVTREDEKARITRVGGAEIVEARGDYLLVDDDVEPGHTYRYQVVVLEDGQAITSFQTSVATPMPRISLQQNYPNPFNPRTEIPFTVDRSAPVLLSVYDGVGRLVRTLIDRPMPQGRFSEQWDGRDEAGQPAASGVYFYRLRVGQQALTKKMVLVK